MLDEPSLGMSPLLTREIFNIIRDINEKEKMTILLVEQNVNIALSYSHFAYLMENGLSSGPNGRRCGEDEDVKEFYLGIARRRVKGINGIGGGAVQIRRSGVGTDLIINNQLLIIKGEIVVFMMGLQHE